MAGNKQMLVHLHDLARTCGALALSLFRSSIHELQRAANHVYFEVGSFAPDIPSRR